MILFFDTETNGLPKGRNASPKDVDMWPRVIQLAWILYDDEGKEAESACSLICPDKWEIPKEKFWIDNGFTTETSQESGISIFIALNGFVNAINKAGLLVAHNIAFDLPIVQAECIRTGMRSTSKPARFCTMKSTTDICKIKGKYNNTYKWPSLIELHNFLFNESFDGAHDALNDVRATAKCFYELNSRDLIKLN